MIKGGELSFETQLKIKFLPPNNGSKQCLEKSLCKKEILFSDYSIFWYSKKIMVGR